MTRPLLLLAALASGGAPLSAQAPSPAATPTNHWVADPAHGAVAFRVRHLGISWVNGTFTQWSAALVYDPTRPESARVVAHIEAGSIDTGNARRDRDVRTNYLAADSFPEITFTSTTVEPTAPGHLRVSGNLTIRGITRPVVLDADVGGVLSSATGRRAAFSATAAITRQDFGITRNRFLEGAQLVGDEVRITIDIEAVEREATP